MRLRIVDHLYAVLDSAEQAIGVGESSRCSAIETVRRHERLNRIERRRRAQRRIAAAVDHLLDLDEEFDLANAAPPALEVIAGTDVRPLSEMVADSRRNLPHLLDHAEIQRAAPDEGLDRI